MARIELSHVTKRWGGFYAVDDLDLVIEDNAFVTLLGPSGCGKTTTLRMIAGLETPTTGKITIDGVTVFDSEAGINIPANKSYWTIIIVLCYCIFILFQIIERRATEIVLAIAWNCARLRLCCLYGVNQFLIGGVEGLHLTLESLFMIVASHARHLAAGHVTAVFHQPVRVSWGTHQEEALSQVLQYLSRNIGLVKLLSG